MPRYSILKRALLAGAVCAAFAGPAAKADIIGYGWHTDSTGVTTVERPIPLMWNGATTLVFRTTKANTFVAVTYNAVCQVHAGDIYGSYGDVRIRITIDDIEPHPQQYAGQPFVLCSSKGTDKGANSRQAAMWVPAAGTHTLRISAALAGSAYNGWLISSSTLIQDQN
jgi:hypothetical protein